MIAPSILITASLAALFYFRYEAITHVNQEWWRTLAQSAIDLGAFSALLLIGAHYLETIRLFTKRLIRTRFAMLGILSLWWITVYNTKTIFADSGLTALTVMIGVVLFLFGPGISARIVESFPIQHREQAALIGRYPPTAHNDMIVFNVVILMVMLAPIVLKNTAWR